MVAIVLHTRDLEPITVVEMAPHLLDLLHKGDHVSLPMYFPCDPSDLEDNAHECMRTVAVHAQRVCLPTGGKSFLYLSNDLALGLKSSLLPGQIRTERAERDRAFYRGAMGFMRE
jgi:hypothetical protein